MRVVDAVAQSLVDEGVEHYFGYIGGAVWPLLDALGKRPELKGIQPKHEAIAVQMADAYFRLRHKIAPVIVTKGPGILNTVCAVSNAMHDSSAVVLIAGSGPTQFFDRGGFEEVYYHAQEDTSSIFKPIVKRAWLVVRPENTVDVLTRAFKTALSGRPGPVLVQIPWDVQNSEVNGPSFKPEAYRPQGRVRADPETLKKAADLIKGAKKPLLVVGGGVLLSEAREEVLSLSKSYNVPIVTTLMAKGAVSEDDPLNLGQIGRAGTAPANKAAKEADVILAVGCRFTDWDTLNWKQGEVFSIPPTKLIHVDIDSSEIGRNYPATVGISGDAKATLAELLEDLKKDSKKANEDWGKTVAAWKLEWESHLTKQFQNDGVPIQPARVYYEIRKAAPRNTLFFIDIGDTIQYAQGYLRITEAGTWFINGGMMQMGWATSAVLTGKMLNPEKPCIAIVGDGAFLMSNTVLATAVEYDIPAIWIIMNNYGPNLERKAQIGLYGKSHPWGSFTKKGNQNELYNPNFVKLAEACGAKGERVEKPTEVGAAIARAMKSGEPFVIDVAIDRDAPTYFAPGMSRNYPKSWSEVAPHF